MNVKGKGGERGRGRGGERGGESGMGGVGRSICEKKENIQETQTSEAVETGSEAVTIETGVDLLRYGEHQTLGQKRASDREDRAAALQLPVVPSGTRRKCLLCNGHKSQFLPYTPKSGIPTPAPHVWSC